MKFLVDAQLPIRFCTWLRRSGFDALHTLELPSGNRTTDSLINDISIDQKRIVVSKDSDFVDTFLLHNKPFKLLLISTGNINNQELEFLLQNNIASIVEAFEADLCFVELTRSTLIVHS